MMFSFPTQVVSFRNVVTTAKQTLYICVASRAKSIYHNDDDIRKMVDPKRVLSYENMLEVIHEPKKVIIDVREPEEVASTGMIPSSINIPLTSVPETLKSMSQEDFRRQFNRDKPTCDDELIFYCKSGRRSSEALDKALQMGYRNSKTYSGSWLEWSSKNGK